MDSDEIPRNTELTARLNDALDSTTSVFGNKPPPGSRTRRDMEYGYWLGAVAALETLAMLTGEAAELMEIAANLYDQACDALADFQKRKR